jgi:hypothetical protein
MVSVVSLGLTMRLAFFQATVRVHQEPTAIPVKSKAQTANTAAPAKFCRTSHASDPRSCYKENAKSTHRNVKKKPETETVGSADLDENEADKGASCDQQPAQTNFQRGIAKNAAKDGN